MFNFSAVLDHHVGLFPDKVALTDGARSVTYRRLHDRVNALAAGLDELGIRRADVVAVVMNNRAEFIETLMAVNRLGAVFLPLNTRLAPSEWQYILGHAEANAIIAEEDFRTGLDSVLPQIPGIRLRLGVGNDDTAMGWWSYDGLIARHDGDFVPAAAVREHDIHRILYTSGTTSRPKGVPISYRNLYWKNFGHILELSISSSDVNLVCGPLYHVGALDAPALDVLHAGGRLVIHRKFQAEEVLETVQRERPTIVWLAPTMLNTLMQVPAFDQYDVSSLRLILFGGEKTPKALIERLDKAFPDTWLCDAYGLTETTSADTFNDADHALSKVGSVGRPVAHLEVTVLDDEGSPVETGEPGEIAVRGPQVFSGYLKDDAATAAAFHGDWFLTGDIGRLDTEGYLYIEDRKKDMIVSGGENISSSEVERAVYEHPDVLEAAVIAAPDRRWGEVPKVYVVPKPGMTLDAGDLQAFCRERLAGFKVPQHVEFLVELPRTPSGKVLKRDLRERHLKAEEAL